MRASLPEGERLRSSFGAGDRLVDGVGDGAGAGERQEQRNADEVHAVHPVIASCRDASRNACATRSGAI